MKTRGVLVFAVLAAVSVCLALAGGASAGSTTNPSFSCTNDYYFSFDQGQFVLVPNGGVSHGGCVSTAAKYGYADLENEAVLSNAALVSNCKLLKTQFEQMTAQVPMPATIGQRTFTDTKSLGDYIFADIFGPDPSTCAAVLAAHNATIANPGPDGPYDVYYTGGHGSNTTYAPGVPAEIAFLFE